MEDGGVTEGVASWHHVDGDPPGTVRRWNGSEWIGVPVPAPAGPGEGADGFVRHHPLARLSPLGSVTAVAAMTSLTALAVVLANITINIFRQSDGLRSAASNPPDGVRPGPDVVVPLGDLGGYFDNLTEFLVLAAALIVLGAFTFTGWLRAAGDAADIRLFRGLSVPPSTLKTPGFVGPLSGGGGAGAGIVVALPVLMAFAVVRFFTTAFLGDIGRKRSLLRVVSDVALVTSMDPATNPKTIDPIKILIWWVLWWGPLLVGIGIWAWVWIVGPLNVGTLAGVLEFNAILLALEAVSLLCIVVTIGQITARLVR